MNKIVSRALTAAALAISLAWTATAGAQGAKAGAATTARPSTAAVPAAIAVVDINKATADELKKVPGIGDAYAAKIIASRPYANKAQLVTKHVMPQGVYDKVKAHLIAKQ